MISDKAIMKEIKYQRNSSIENPLAYSHIPSGKLFPSHDFELSLFLIEYQPQYHALV